MVKGVANFSSFFPLDMQLSLSLIFVYYISSVIFV